MFFSTDSRFQYNFDNILFKSKTIKTMSHSIQCTYQFIIIIIIIIMYPHRGFVYSTVCTLVFSIINITFIIDIIFLVF